MKLSLLALASLGLCVTASASLKQIEGTWKGSWGAMGSNQLPKSLIEKMVLIIKGGTFDYDEGNGHDIGKLKEIKGSSPLAMDIIGTKGPNKGRTYPAIYKLEGNILTIYYGLDGHRPKSFEEKADSPNKTLLMKFRKG